MIPMFGRKPAALDRPAALENFKRDIGKAIDAARFGGVDCATLADLFDERAAGLRRTAATSVSVAPRHHTVG